MTSNSNNTMFGDILDLSPEEHTKKIEKQLAKSITLLKVAAKELTEYSATVSTLIRERAEALRIMKESIMFADVVKDKVDADTLNE
jgi:ABC-type Na+ transport system ATPase subunit NatA